VPIGTANVCDSPPGIHHSCEPPPARRISAIPHLAAVGHSTRKIFDGSAVRNAQWKAARKSVATVNKFRGVPVEECK
jgi:hypothetical protein